MPNDKAISNKSSYERPATSGKPVAWWHWHRRLYNWVVHWADTRYGMAVLIVLALTEPICVPIPADVLVVGLCLGKPKRSLKYGLTCAFFSVMGGTIAFSLGLAIGPERVVDLFSSIGIGAKAQLALDLYTKYDFWAIAISALTPVPYMIFSWLGGMAEVSLLKFVTISIVFRTMRFGGESLLFYFLGEKARRLIEKYFNIATVVVIILLICVVYAIRLLGRMFSG